MYRSSRLLAFGIALPLCLASETGTAGARESVTLKFDWPAGLRAKVTFLNRFTRKSSIRNAETTTYGTYAMTAKAQRRGLLIAYDNFNARVRAKGPDAVRQRLIGKLASVQPDFLVDASGQFVRPVGLDDFRREVEKAVDQSLADLPQAYRRRSGQVRQKAIHRLSQQIQTQLKNQWDMVVGVLIDLKLTKDRPVVRRISQPVALLRNAYIPVTSTVKFVGWSRCGKAASYRRCVELVTETWIDRGAVDRAVHRIVRGVSGDDAETPVARKYDMRQWTRILAEPATLVVHRVHIRKTVTASVAAGEKIENFVAKTESKLVYRY